MLLSLAWSSSTLTVPGTLSKESLLLRKEERPLLCLSNFAPLALSKLAYSITHPLWGSLCFPFPVGANGIIRSTNGTYRNSVLAC